jgi:general secretion pathway protein B
MQRPNSAKKTGFGSSGSEKNSDDKSNANEQDKYQPERPAPISYWELPDTVRADVPEIKFSVLVYATDPADRFVLINGQRHSEGESTQPGLVIEEIRLDGVVFSYRLYQFLIER